jgi:signal peptidase I
MRSNASPAARSATTLALRARSRRTIGRAARRVLDVALRLAVVVALAVLVGLALLPRTGWYRVETVLSGSMQPTFAPGDLIVVTPEPAGAVGVGQVISYSIPVDDHHVETHRIARILQRGEHPVIRTKGDANNGLDPWTARLSDSTAWRLRATVPNLGWLIVWLRSPVFHFLTVFLAPLLLALVWLGRIWRKPGGGEGQEDEDMLDAAPSVTAR